mgnify:CR=1 FL=1
MTVGGMEVDDEQIIALYFARDEAAITETDNKYGKLCYGIAHHILLNDEHTEECVNDAYLAVWNTIPPTHPNNFTAFICKIIRNLALKRLEYENAEKRRSNFCCSLSDLEEIIPDERIRPEIGEKELGGIISDFLRCQKAEARNVFIRKYWFFDSVSDIARRYHFSESKVKSMLYHTRNKLRDYLRKEGIEL